MLTHRQIRYFLAVVDTGQVSAAAQLLNVSQSAVTLSIKDMEAHLGVLLFDRLPSGLRLTRAGQQFQTHARDIATSFEAAEKSVVEEGDTVAGQVRLGLSWTLSSYFAFPIIEQFSRQHPRVNIQLVEQSRETLENSLLNDELDLALVLTSNLARGIGLGSKTLHKSPRRLWTSMEHPLAKSGVVTLSEVAQFSYAILQSDEAQKQGLAHWTEATGFPDVVFSSGSIEAVRSLVATGRAVTILSDVVYRPWTLDGRRVERIELAETIPTMDVGVAWKARQTLGPAARLLRDAFEKSISIV